MLSRELLERRCLPVRLVAARATRPPSRRLFSSTTDPGRRRQSRICLLQLCIAAQPNQPSSTTPPPPPPAPPPLLLLLQPTHTGLHLTPCSSTTPLYRTQPLRLLKSASLFRRRPTSFSCHSLPYSTVELARGLALKADGTLGTVRYLRRKDQGATQTITLQRALPSAICPPLVAL